MQIDDRREEWMGLGILLAELRFRTWIENRHDSKLGVRVRTSIGWRSLFTSGSLAQQSRNAGRNSDLRETARRHVQGRHRISAPAFVA